MQRKHLITIIVCSIVAIAIGAVLSSEPDLNSQVHNAGNSIINGGIVAIVGSIAIIVFLFFIAKKRKK